MFESISFRLHSLLDYEPAAALLGFMVFLLERAPPPLSLEGPLVVVGACASQTSFSPANLASLSLSLSLSISISE